MEGSWWKRIDGGIEIVVRVVPGARRTEVVGEHDGSLRVRLGARPVDGQANRELIRFVAELCEVRRSAVTIVRGERARTKALRVAGRSTPPVIAALD